MMLFAGALTLVPGPFRERVDLITKEIRGACFISSFLRNSRRGLEGKYSPANG